MPAGTVVYDVNAKYDGKTDEKNFKYSIAYGEEDKFKIHFETGRVTTLVSLDREMQTKYTVRKNFYRVIKEFFVDLHFFIFEDPI